MSKKPLRALRLATLWLAGLLCLPALQAAAPPAAATSAVPAAAPAVPAEAAAPEALPAGVTAGPRIEGVSEYRLANGLRVVLAPDRAKPVVTVVMNYMVGARHEPYGATGMAHLLEHMLFRGTPTLKDALAEFSRRGLQANGTTNPDRTNYYASFAADPATLDWFLRWQADTMVNALIDPQDLAAEMPVVRNELEQAENSPFRMLLERLQSVAFDWHGYGRGVLGARSDLERMSAQRLRAFYQTHYQPDNAVLVVGGDFDPQATLAVIAEAFGAIPRPARILPEETTVEPVQDGERQVTLRRPGGSPLAAALYRAPGASSPDALPLSVGAAILSDVPAGRLYQRLVEPGLAAAVFGYAAGLQQPGYVIFGAQLEPGMQADRALAALEETLENLSGQPFTQEELDRIRTRWRQGWSDTRADGARLAHALSSAAVDGDWRLFFLQRDQIEALELAEVQRVTEAYLTPANRTSGRYLPTPEPRRAPEPPAGDPAALLAGYEGRDDASDIPAFEASAAAIQAASQRETLSLPGGPVQLALLPKPTPAQRVQLVLTLQSGDAESLRGKRQAADAVAALLHHGTARLSRQEISDRYDRLHSQVSFHGGPGTVVVGLRSQREHLAEALELTLQLLREASFPPEALQEYQRQSRTALEQAMTNPSTMAYQALARHDNPWPADDPRYAPSFDEARQAIDALDVEQLRDYHRRFYGTGSLLLSAVGDFDPDVLRASLAKGLEGWHAAAPYERLAQPYRDVPAARYELDSPGKANGYFLARLPLPLGDEDPDFPALLLANHLLGDSPSSRLWQRIRVQEGISYDVDSDLSASAYEANGDWTLSALFAPADRRRLEQGVQEELARVLREGYTEQEVSQAIETFTRQRRLAYANDRVIASQWNRYLRTGRDFGRAIRMEQALAGQNAATVNAALRRWLDPARLSIAIAADAGARPAAQAGATPVAPPAGTEAAPGAAAAQ